MGSRPDRAFRIADRRNPIFDGTGAFLNGARWNSPGYRVVYAAETFAGAMLEILVHARVGKVPKTQSWIEITIPADVSVEHVRPEAVPEWGIAESPQARHFGDAWCRERRSLVLVVPSAAAGGLSSNILFNQDHPEFQRLSATEPRPIAWDARLFVGSVVNTD
jgi:RES domain-containing protein